MKKDTWKKKVFAFGLIFVMIMCSMMLGGCGGEAPAEEAPEEGAQAEEVADNTVYEWDLVVTTTLDHIIAQGLQQYADEVEQATNGQLRITIRPTGELPFAQDEYLAACRDGSVEMAVLNCSAVSTQLQSAALPSLPMLITSPEDKNMFFDVLGSDIDSELGEYGVSLITDVYFAGQNFWGVGEAPTSLENLKGQKVRVQGVEQSDFVQKLGMIPVTINWAEVPTSINRGVVDSYITANATVFDGAGNEYTDWGYVLPIMNITCYVVANDAALAGLPEDVRATLLELGQTYSDTTFTEIANEYDEIALSGLEERGMTLNNATDDEMNQLYAMMGDYWKEWAEKKGGSVPEKLDVLLEQLGK